MASKMHASTNMILNKLQWLVILEHTIQMRKGTNVNLMDCSGVGTYTDTPDWSGQSFWKIILKTQSEIVDSIPLY